MHPVSARSLRHVERFISSAEQFLTEFVRTLARLTEFVCGLARHVDQPVAELTNDEADAD